MTRLRHYQYLKEKYLVTRPVQPDGGVKRKVTQLDWEVHALTHKMWVHTLLWGQVRAPVATRSTTRRGLWLSCKKWLFKLSVHTRTRAQPWFSSRNKLRRLDANEPTRASVMSTSSDETDIDNQWDDDKNVETDVCDKPRF